MQSPEDDFVLVNEEDTTGSDQSGIQPLPVEEQDKIRTWLQPTDYSADSSEYHRHLSSHVPGTTEWAHKPEYQQWISSQEQGSLWVKAIAGAGKSVAAAYLAYGLQKDKKCPVLYFFFRQIIENNRLPISLLRDWLSQMLEFSSSLQWSLKASYLDQTRSLDSVAFDELWRHFENAVCNLRRVYCFADALDEMSSGNGWFIERLANLGQLKPANVKVLLTSRPLPQIESVLRHDHILKVSLSRTLVDQDIAVYIQHRVQKSKLHKDLWQDAQDSLMSKSQGSFLYTRLTMDDLLNSATHDLSNAASVREALDGMPDGLSEKYTAMLHDHSTRSGVPQSLQLLILRWVTHSSRPLRLLEIAAMVDSLPPDKGILDSHTQRDQPHRNTKSVIRGACGPLIEILEDETVGVIHHSFTEYLTDMSRIATVNDAPAFPLLNSKESHLHMAIVCVNYLTSGWAEAFAVQGDGGSSSRLASKSDRATFHLHYPFLKYASLYWPYHASQFGASDDVLFQSFDSFFLKNQSAFAAWLELRAIVFNGLRLKNFYKSSPLHVVAKEGLSCYLEHLICLGHNFTAKDERCGTPMHSAATSGSTSVIEVLLNHGADPDPDNFCGLKPLHLAAMGNHASIVKTLLGAGVSPHTPKTRESPGRRCGNAPRTRGNTPVQYAFGYGHLEAAVAFVPFLDSDALSKALMWAAEARHTNIVLAVLNLVKVNVNEVVNEKTLLFLAAHQHQPRLIRKFLDLGADGSILSNPQSERHFLSIGDRRSSTPLHGLALGKPNANVDSNMTVDALRLLLDCGGDIDAVNAMGATPLHLAVDLGQSYEAKPSWTALALLDNGASPSSVSKDGFQPLHLARNSPELVHALCRRGADVNAVNPKDGRTALHYAMEDNSLARMEALLDLKADCGVQDKCGDTPLHVAIARDSPNMFEPARISADCQIKPLLEHGANPNARNKVGKTPLHCLGSTRFKKPDEVKQFVATLLNAGAYLESRMPCGKTFFLEYMSNNGRGSKEDFSFLTEAGCKKDICDYEGRNILHLLVAKGVYVEPMLRLIIKEEIVDPLAPDFAGNTLLHYLARHTSCTDSGTSQHRGLFELLLELGFNVVQQNNLGQTPFYVVLATTGVAGTFKENLLNFLTVDQRNSTINMADRDGIRPIHLGAIRGEEHVRWLADRGANPFVLTNDGQSALHLAARARQSNVLGFLVELCQSRNRPDFIDHTDDRGRTALHYACRSGRIESVRVLTDSGARINTLDFRNLSPLDACAEFVRDNTLFPNNGVINATDVMRDSDYRTPLLPQHANLNGFHVQFDELDTVGIRYIVRHLIARGADVINTPLDEAYFPPRENNVENVHLNYARNTGCTILLQELMPEVVKAEKAVSPDTAGQCPRRRYTIPSVLFLEDYYCARGNYFWEGLKDFMEPGNSNSTIFETLLRNEDSRGIDAFMEMATEPLVRSSWHGHPIEKLVKYGYADILRKLDIISSPAVLPQEVEVDGEKIEGLKLSKYLLFVACERELPNLEVLKVLVETGKFDVNCVNYVEQYGRRHTDETVLHKLAKSQHWWQLEAIKYLVEKGANIDHRSSTGMTPLHIAAQNGLGRAVEALLANGANPNLVADDGLSCLTRLNLNSRPRDSNIAHLLLDLGANPNLGARSLLFDAICSMNVYLVTRLVHLQSDPNRLCEVPMAFSNQKLRPLQLAGRANFNTNEARLRMIPIIEALLRGGAQPFILTNDGLPILHEICESGGIVEPFLAVPDVDIEARDCHGRTLFLAACSHAAYSDRFDGDRTSLTTAQQLAAHGADILAVDHENRNALHLLLRDCREKYRALSRAVHCNLDFLLSHPSAPTLIAQRDTGGMTPLLQAAQSGAFSLIAPLLAKGADPFAVDPAGNSVLHLAAPRLPSWPTSFDTFSDLLSLKLPLNALNHRGESPLFLYVRQKGALAERLPFFEVAGADFHTRDKRGQGLLHVIAAKKSDRWEMRRCKNVDARSELFNWVMGKGVDVGWEDEGERTALDVAAGVGNESILGLFKRKE